MTTLADLRLAAQEQCDRVNSATPATPEWDRYINRSAAKLYRIIGQTYEDYNVQQYPFTLNGGNQNTLQIGPGSGVPQFDKIRHIARVVTQGTPAVPATYAPVLRADSIIQFDELSAPLLSTYYSAFVAVKYWLYGTTIEIRPAVSAGAQYLLYYIPSFQPLVNDTDTIDGTWMATNGIDEYIIYDAAAKAMIKEESLDTAQLLQQQRDDNQPGRILDVKRARAAMGWGQGWGGYAGY